MGLKEILIGCMFISVPKSLQFFPDPEIVYDIAIENEYYSKKEQRYQRFVYESFRFIPVRLNLRFPVL